jgi:bacterial/archaeal transporter family protein
MKDIPLLLLAVLAHVMGNLSLSHGMKQVGDMPTLSAATLLQFGLSTIANGWVILGVALLIGFFLLFLVALSRHDLSYVQPMIASSYVFTAIFAGLFLQEHISFNRWVGTLVIALGIFLVGANEQRSKKRSKRYQRLEAD